MTSPALTPDVLAAIRVDFPTPALTRGQVVEIFQRCKLGGLPRYKKLKSAGVLVPLRNLPGATQARYNREAVLALVSAALAPAAASLP